MSISSENNVRALALFDELRDLTIGDLDNDAIVKLGRQIMQVLPTRSIRNPVNAVAYALHCQSVGGNILRGEPYGFENKDGKLQIVDPYKIRVRWAKRIADYTETFTVLNPEQHGQKAGDIVVRCTILRNDKESFMFKLMDHGMPYEKARSEAGSSALGVVELEEMFLTRKKVGSQWVQAPRDEWKDIHPPKGWTWTQRAETRALKNALQRSHGTPSTKELAQESWTVGDVQTIPSDWATVRPGASPQEAADTALVESQARAWKEQIADQDPQAILARARAILHGEEEDSLAPEALAGDVVGGAELEEVIEPEGVVEPGKPEETETLESLLDDLSVLLAELGDAAEITKGKDRYLVQQVFAALDLGTPRWPLVVEQVAQAVAVASETDVEAEAEAEQDGR